MKKIEELRKELNMSLKEFSEYYEIPYNTVRQWEKGERTPPKYVIKLLNEVIDLKAKGVQMEIIDDNIIYLHELVNSYGQKWSKHVYEKEDYDLLIKEHQYYCGEGRFKEIYKDKIYKALIIEEIEP